jgi:SpoVK/Ycf46/Vps4 family AAA+-type ATPase
MQTRIQAPADVDIEVEVPAADEELMYVLTKYSDLGPLAADNILEQGHGKGSPGLQALQFIISKELDPQGQLNFVEVSARAWRTPLCDALCAWALALTRTRKFPLQAREHALDLIRYDDGEMSEILPRSWVEQANQIIAAPSKPNYRSVSVDSQQEDTIAKQWRLIQRRDPDAPEVMNDSILKMIGLSAVKENLRDIYHRIKLSQEQNDGAAASYNVRFEGNPGTGKTTIARHYGMFLQQLKVLPDKSVFKETSGAKLIADGVKGLTKLLDEAKKAGGGVVFADEAYQLISDREGKKVLDFILPLAENLDSEFGPLVWIFAGYKKQMETLFEYNDGLPSRFPQRFVFEDYTDEELQQIFEDMMKYQNKPAVPVPTSPASPTQLGPTGGGYRGRGGGGSQTDRFGRSWNYVQPTSSADVSKSGWTDSLGNRTVNPISVGIRGSELVDKKGQQWIENQGIWSTRVGATQSHYPGEPPPPSTGSRVLRETPFRCDPRDLRIAIRRLGRRRGSQGFGNARAVRVTFENIRDRQAARVTEERRRGQDPDVFLLARTDLLGPDISEQSLQKSKAWRTLDNLEGLQPVKESVAQLLSLVLKNVVREQREEPLYEITLNRLFLGNPGTGKTTVATLYGKILVDLGLLSKGEVIEKCASDFVGDVLGSSEKTTRSILQTAEGNVLVIDEAYSLYSGGQGPSASNDPYKTAVIDTIVEQVQARPGADSAVVMLGYQAQMENMMSKVNPGLSRRFQIENAFQFPDFDDAALVRILMQKGHDQALLLGLNVAKRAVLALAKARAKPNFGNAGAVDNILSKAVSRMQMRTNAIELIPEDFEYAGDGPDGDVLETLFDGLIGCREVQKTMDELRCTVEFSLEQGKAPVDSVSLNYLFLGSPGTGKTTVARRMGKMFNALGLLATDEMKEIKASDLITGYVGQAGEKTREVLRAIRGGVLFIDEAYQLNPARGGNFMTEVVDELVGALTEEEFKGKLLVILAGYDQDMEEMLAINPGLKSRFSERVHFPNFDVNATAQLLLMELDKQKIPLHTADTNDVCRLAQKLVDSEDFGNGRDVVTWANNIYREVAKAPRQKRATTFSSSLVQADKALQVMLKSRAVREGGPQCVTLPTGRTATMDQKVKFTGLTQNLQVDPAV